jgi:hypothetical protein
VAIDKNGYILVKVDGVMRRENVYVAEKAFGRPLPSKAEVHHVNCDRTDNRPKNLVVCPDGAYHKLLHRRIRAMEACGNPNFRKCGFCKKYDDLANLRSHGRNQFCHGECENQYKRDKATERGYWRKS